MPAPLLVPLILLGGATIALAAASAKKKRTAGELAPSGTAKTYTLDASMPVPLRDQVLAALASGSDPANLEAFASSIVGSYPLAAAALRTKATALRAIQGLPTMPTAPPALPTNPIVAPPIVPTAPMATPPAQPPLQDWQAQLMSLPEPTRTQVLQAMMGQNDPNALEAFAKQLDAQYPVAAWALRVREAALRGQPYPAMPSSPAPATPPVVPTPNSPPPPPPPPPPNVQPAPTRPPASPPAPLDPPSIPMPSLPLSPFDPGMPVEMQKAVAGALTTESDPAKLEGFASAIQAQYPIASGLLMAKAQALRLAQVPHVLPVQPSPPKPLGPSSGPSILPFPASGTYTVKSGDYPIKIAQLFTGNGNGRWKELIAANPEKPTRADGAWTTLMPGEVVKLPPTWNTNVSVKAPAALPAAGGTHAAHP